MLKFKILFSIWLLGSHVLFSQTKVSGNVFDQKTNEAIIGATIVNLKTGSGTVTDIDGSFSLEMTKGDNLEVSYLGYSTLSFTYADEPSLSFGIQTSNNVLEEVIVVGYGTQKSKDLTGSITTIRTEEILKTPSSNAMQSLQGKVAGLQIVSSGQPGRGATVRVRGIGSFPNNALGNNENNTSPLYVVDGMFFDNIDFLSPSDIATISVLKDASAAAIYGVRAANGVILIETKSGSFEQKAQISYDGYTGVQVAQNVLRMANAEQFVTFAKESGSVADIQYVDNAMQRFGRSRTNFNLPDVNTNWYKEVTRPARMQNHSLDVSGGSNKSNYSLGLNYMDQNGILNMENYYQRINLRGKINFKATDWMTIGSNVVFSNATQQNPENGAWGQAYFAVPILPVYDEANTKATPINFASAQSIGYRDGQNPMPALNFSDLRDKIRQVLGNMFVQIDLMDDLEFKSAYNYAYSGTNTRQARLPYFVSTGLQRNQSNLIKRVGTGFNQIWDNTLTYNKKVNNHNFTILGGTSFRDEAFETLSLKGNDFPYQDKSTWYLENSTPVTDIKDGDVGDGGSRFYGMSYFGRLSYNFKNKYILYGTYRADGTNKYQEKFGYFPSVGLGWVVSQEGFFKNNVVDYLKLRGSWGVLGNDKVPFSDGSNTTSLVTTSINDQLVTGTVSSNTFDFLRWERVAETNVGLSAFAFDQKLSIEADYYVRKTNDAQIRITAPLTGATFRRSAGVIQNSGVELGLRWSESLTENFRYAIGGNFSTLKNKVISLSGQEYIDGGTAEFRQRSIVGQSLLAFYGWEVAGVYQNQAEIEADPIAKANKLEPGDFKYVDRNGDKVIDDLDRGIIGSFLPSFTYGGDISVGYKAIDLSVNFYGQGGNQILNRNRGQVIFTNDQNIDADLVDNRWHGEGTSDSYTSAKGRRKGWNQKMSTFFVEDGDFFRIQNVTLSYTIKKGKLFNGLPEIRINATAERPLTLFDYNGFSPEVQNGIDNSTHPIPAIYTMGLNIKF
ncbi:MAG: TonB-dependent receptor [Saprospiraceae bacterium]|jgi:TonB-linked SusC/RagA family outer membrane protein|nr:TonB-dependent receptor [Saprospiraceae bacterium]